MELRVQIVGEMNETLLAESFPIAKELVEEAGGGELMRFSPRVLKRMVDLTILESVLRRAHEHLQQDNSAGGAAGRAAHKEAGEQEEEVAEAAQNAAPQEERGV